jgi:hypothetical protein
MSTQQPNNLNTTTSYQEELSDEMLDQVVGGRLNPQYKYREPLPSDFWDPIYGGVDPDTGYIYPIPDVQA